MILRIWLESWKPCPRLVPSRRVLVLRRPYTLLPFPEQVHSQETQAGFSSRETDEAVDTLSALRKEIDARALQQSHMDDFRRTNDPEVKELHRICDRSKVLECECAALQRHYKAQEVRMASSDRAVITARESLAQAQQLAAEWEQRAKESAAALEEAQALRGQAEDRAVRLEAEQVLLRMQLDEKERHAKVRLAPCRVAEP